jgi:hypothetical protein
MTASSLSLSTAQALAGTTVASTASGLIAWSTPFQAVGIGPAVIFMALAGTAAGLLWQPPGCSRGRLFGLAFVYTVVSAALAVVLGEIPGFTFFKAVAPATALLFAFFAHTLFPNIRDALAVRIRRSVGGEKP